MSACISVGDFELLEPHQKYATRCDKRDGEAPCDLGQCGIDSDGIWWAVHPAIAQMRAPKIGRVLTHFMNGAERPDLETWSAWECDALSVLNSARVRGLKHG